MPIKLGSTTMIPKGYKAVYWGSKLVYGGSSPSWETISGIPPFIINNARENIIKSLVQYGKCTQASTPTPISPVDIVCNNGALGINGQTVGNPEVITVSNNVYNMSGAVNISLSNAVSSNTVAYNSGSKSFCIPIKPNTTYTIGFKSTPSGGSIYRAATTQNKVTSGNSQTAIYATEQSPVIYSPITFNSGVGANYLYIQFSTSYIEEIKNVLIVQAGNTITTQTANAQNLYAVGNYKDEQDIVSGVTTHRIGVLVMDGSEDITYASNRFRISVDRVIAKTGVICTHFAYTDAISTQMENGTVGLASASDTVFFRNDACSNTEQFKNFLSSEYSLGKPIILLYPLATSTTEQATAQPLSTSDGTNTISVTAEVSGIEFDVTYSKR